MRWKQFGFESELRRVETRNRTIVIGERSQLVRKVESRNGSIRVDLRVKLNLEGENGAIERL